jgi:hypothetical protein
MSAARVESMAFWILSLLISAVRERIRLSKEYNVYFGYALRVDSSIDLLEYSLSKARGRVRATPDGVFRLYFLDNKVTAWELCC